MNPAYITATLKNGEYKVEYWYAGAYGSYMIGWADTQKDVKIMCSSYNLVITFK